MPWKLRRLPWLALPLAYFLYFFGITAAGLVGPDEPRYASIGRAMAQSGDWITPRLWGAPWFEKPALLYWMIAAGFRAGLGPDLAPRLPVALLSVTFLVFFWWILWREFGCLTAWMATLILATSAGWCLYSQSGVTDIPLSATFAAAMLLGMGWVARRETRWLPFAGALFGLAVLAKGPVALVLAAPLAMRWRYLADWLRPRVVVTFLVVAAPWYLSCYLRNGAQFFDEFIWKHNIGRFTSPELQHVQSWWFYGPAIVVLFVPWSGLLPLAFRRGAGDDPRRRFLQVWAAWTFLFFSIAVNKLAGYVLPAFPAIAALIALGLAEARQARIWLAGTALLLVAFPVVAPWVEISGLSRSIKPAFSPLWLLPLLFAAAAWILDARARRLAAVACIACGAAAGIVYLKLQIGRKTFARELWNDIAPRASETCVAYLDRNWRYGLNYYSVTPLPDCSAAPRPLEIRQDPNGAIHVDRR